MAVQTSNTIQNYPFIRGGSPKHFENEIIAQIADRVGDLLPHTVMAKVAVDGKWSPFRDETATDGTAIPYGIYLGGTITEAQLKAGDIPACPILVMDAVIDINQLIIENGKTLDTKVTVGTTMVKTVEDFLLDRGIICQTTVDTTSL